MPHMQVEQAVRVATQYAPVRCGPAAAHPLLHGAQRALVPIAVGSMNINDLMNINDVGYASPPR